MSALFLDIHSHTAAGGNSWAIQNRYNGFGALPATGFFSAGLHPWYITEHSWKQELALLNSISTQQQVLAIGECGLDKVCKTDFSLQQTVFAAQVQLANTINKPLIIHCVKAYDEVLQLLQRNQVPAIFHGFNKSAVLAQQLTGKGFYLSFGKALLQPHMQDVLQALPAGKIFFETDDAAVSIETIYNAAAAILQIDINALSLQLQKNAALVFGASFFKL